MATSVGRFEEGSGAIIEPLGRTEVHEGELFRHSAYTRLVHWLMATSFFLALFSGFGIYLPWVFRWFTPVFGGGTLTRILHPYFGVAFVFFFALEFVNWLPKMRWGPADNRWWGRLQGFLANQDKVEAEDVGFYNAGQKVQYWEIAGGSIVYLITGIILWMGADDWGRMAVAVSYVLHDISALIMLFGIFIHVYISTFGQPGTFSAMSKGTVTEAWAWTHCPAWFREVTGRDPKKALEEERQRQAAIG